ncbi:hypothetical protein ACFFU1_06260 [Algibacter miyuki]|uniref:Uncharacterized protein n=1 Tax=Algibacter miyuki TaxID=1306933 RepID=A0ABV5GXV1_9FLAO|nr:hypothetical protein [Algibacter miyuki]MDN3667311.1 hypothetical protein [Algibacter miyuki]
MTLELIIFIAAILFGIFIYWQESRNNGVYRFFNKVINSKALQMKPHDRTGFVYQQSFLLRVVFVGFLYLIAIVIIRFLIPIDVATISIFASMIVGTLVGTYLANFIFKSSEVIEEQAESLEDIMQDTIEKGKDILDDLTRKDETLSEQIKEAEPKVEEKSARERLKDKGLL